MSEREKGGRREAGRERMRERGREGWREREEGGREAERGRGRESVGLASGLVRLCGMPWCS